MLVCVGASNFTLHVYFFVCVVEVKVFFSRPFESTPKVDAWIISCDEIVRVPHKCIVPANGFFTAKVSLCAKDSSGLSIHWTAFAEHESNEAFNTAMQSIMTLPKMTPADLMAMVKRYESSNLLYLTDSSGQNLVHASAQAGNYELTKILIEKGVDFDLKDIHGWTPLITAVNAGNFEIANLLISKNASLTTTTVRNGTLLHYLMKSPRK